MLAIRLQRTGRSGHAMFRVVVQDARRTPTSGKLVAQLGSYDPRTKQVRLDNEKVTFYLEHGAQPSGRVIRLLKTEKIKVPKWAASEPEKTSTVRYPDKLRRNRPDEPVKPVAETEESTKPVEEATVESPAEPEAVTDEAAKPSEVESTEADQPTDTAVVESEKEKV